MLNHYRILRMLNNTNFGLSMYLKSIEEDHIDNKTRGDIDQYVLQNFSVQSKTFPVPRGLNQTQHNCLQAAICV